MGEMAAVACTERGPGAGSMGMDESTRRVVASVSVRTSEYSLLTGRQE